MDGIGTGRLCSGQNRLAVQIGLGSGIAPQGHREIRGSYMPGATVRVGINGDGFQAHGLGSAHDPHRNLTAVGHQYSLYGLHVLNLLVPAGFALLKERRDPLDTFLALQAGGEISRGEAHFLFIGQIRQGPD